MNRVDSSMINLDKFGFPMVPLLIRAACIMALTLSAAVVQAQITANRLPLDPAPEPRPAVRVVPFHIEKDSLAHTVPSGAENIWLKLVEIRLEGSTANNYPDLSKYWSNRVGQEVALTDIFSIATQMTSELRNIGYVLSQVIVPQQDIDPQAGQVTLRVLEGHVSSISVSGVSDELQQHIRAVLRPITREKPLTAATLERQLLLLNDIPGLTARAHLKAGSETGSTELMLVASHRPGGFGMSLHNRVSEAVGPVRLEVSADRQGVMGATDRHQLRAASSGNSRLALLSYAGDVALFDDGLNLNWSLSGSRSKPKSGAAFQLDTNSDSFGVGVSYPLVRSRELNIGARVGLSAYNGRTVVAGDTVLSRDRLRVLRVGGSFDHTDSLDGVNLLDIEYSRGIPGLGSSRAGDPLLQIEDSIPQFSKATVYLARLQSLGGGLSVLVAATGQYSGHRLGSSEQFGLGGENFLRAYDSSELSGDKGVATKVELRSNVAFGDVGATVYGFFDAGWVRLNSPIVNSSDRAQSLGMGLRFGWESVKGFVEVAKPRQRVTNARSDMDPRVFGGMAVDF